MNAARSAMPGRLTTAPAKQPAIKLELAEIFRNWERASSKIQTLETKFKRFTYDLVFEVEKRAKGTFYYEAPNKGRLEIRGEKPLQGAVSKRKSRSGKAFKLEGDRPQTWVWNGHKVYQFDEAEKTVQVFAILKQSDVQDVQQVGFWNLTALALTISRPQGVLPFVVDIHADELQRRFDWKLLKQTENQVWLSATRSALRSTVKR